MAAKRLNEEIPRSARDFGAAQFLACPEQLSRAKLSNGPAKRLNLLKRFAASTLEIFQCKACSPGDHEAGRMHG